jgi:hypothetical protein
VKKGRSAIAEANASRISPGTACTNAIAAKNTIEIASDQIITIRRSYRSPSTPANGPTIPATPNVSSNESACIAGECVRDQTVKLSAAYAAALPVTEMRRPVARRRIFERAAVG